MDPAVALVEAYLRVNGYFTVTEFPVLEIARGECRTVTDLDILAFRFAGAGNLVPAPKQRDTEQATYAPDSELGCQLGCPDMLIGEVKEGRAELNQGATNPAVLRSALTRFGCCHANQVPAVVRELLREGHAQTHCGHRVRLVAFGSTPGPSEGVKCQFVSLRHIEQFLREYIRDNWNVVHHAQFKDPRFAFLVLLEKAQHGHSLPSVIARAKPFSTRPDREDQKEDR